MLIRLNMVLRENSRKEIPQSYGQINMVFVLVITASCAMSCMQ